MASYWQRVCLNQNLEIVHNLVWPFLEDGDVTVIMRSNKEMHKYTIKNYVFKSMPFSAVEQYGNRYADDDVRTQSIYAKSVHYDEYDLARILSRVRVRCLMKIDLRHFDVDGEVALLKNKDWQQLTTLKLPHTFNRTDFSSSLCSTLTHLTFGAWFHQPIPSNTLPQSLKKLVFGENFNHSFEVGCLPDSLEHLELGTLFNQKLSIDNLPSKLLILNMIRCNFFIDSHLGILPASITQLSMPRRFQNSDQLLLSRCRLRELHCSHFETYNYRFVSRMSAALLKEATHLHVIEHCNEPTKCIRDYPPNIISLILSTPDNEDRHLLSSPRYFPQKLVTLTFKNLRFSDQIPQHSLPNTLTSLSFHMSIYSFPFDDYTIPTSVTNLVMPLYRNHVGKWTDYLPRHLKRLELYNSTNDDIPFLPFLQVLIFAGDYNKPFTPNMFSSTLEQMIFTKTSQFNAPLYEHVKLSRFSFCCRNPSDEEMYHSRLPPQLNVLEFHNHYNHNLPTCILPKSLKILKHPNTFLMHLCPT